MSPFSADLKSLRETLHLKQGELAERMGYEQSYLSAIEIGTKGPPTRDFVERLIRCLNLDNSWRVRLYESWSSSERKLMLPNEAPEDVYRFCNELRQQICCLHPSQIELMRFALKLPEQMASTPAVGLWSTRRVAKGGEM